MQISKICIDTLLEEVEHNLNPLSDTATYDFTPKIYDR